MRDEREEDDGGDREDGEEDGDEGETCEEDEDNKEAGEDDSDDEEEEGEGELPLLITGARIRDSCLRRPTVVCSSMMAFTPRWKVASVAMPPPPPVPLRLEAPKPFPEFQSKSLSASVPSMRVFKAVAVLSSRSRPSVFAFGFEEGLFSR